MQLAEPFLLNALAYLESAPGFLCYMLLKLVGWPYGRYALVRSAFRLPEQAAWAVQELPSRALPLLAGPTPPAERLNHWPSCILLAMFLVYYVQRALISPFSDPRRKARTLYWHSCSAPITGYLQSRYLSQYAVHADDWLTDP